MSCIRPSKIIANGVRVSHLWAAGRRAWLETAKVLELFTLFTLINKTKQHPLGLESILANVRRRPLGTP